MARPKTIHGKSIVKNIVFEDQRLEEFQELCQKTRKSMSEYIRDLISEELQKKEIGLENNPIAVSYSATMPNNNKHKRLISVFEDSASTKTDVFHMLKGEKVDNDDLNKLHNYCTNFLGGISAYRPNIVRLSG